MKKNIYLDIPFFSQNNSLKISKRWKQKICGLVCIKMCIEYFNSESPSFQKLLKFKNQKYKFLNLNSGEEKEYQYYLKGTGWLHYGLLAIAKKNGLSGICEKINHTEAELYFQEQLNNNTCIIASVNLNFNNKELKGGHLVIIKGIEFKNNKTFLFINDPIKEDGNLNMEIGKFLDNFNGNIILISKNNQEKFCSNSPINIDIYSNIKINNSLKNIYFHIHENEQIAKNETTKFIKKTGIGELLCLTQNNERFLRFSISSKKHQKSFLRIDPNRIFSQKELEKTIIERNSHLDSKILPKAIDVTKKIKNYIISKLVFDKKINYICVHTNKLLNINNFIGKCDLININPKLPQNSFIIVPDRSCYKKLAKKNMNVLYYKNENDGSLRNYLQNKGYKSFSIETGEDDSKTYKLYLEQINSIFSHYN